MWTTTRERERERESFKSPGDLASPGGENYIALSRSLIRSRFFSKVLVVSYTFDRLFILST